MIEGTFFTKLINLALRGLAPLYDDRQQLFAYQIQRGQKTPMPLAWSLTYTAITLIGLIKARQHGWREIPLDELAVLQSLVRQPDGLTRPGDLGLILWADAQCGGFHRETLLEAVKRQAQVETLTQMTTMELAWLLTGLSYTRRCAGWNGAVEKLALTFCEAIASNFNRETSLFSHRRAGTWPAGLRNEIGNFADQIYAVYALSTFCEIFDRPEALQWAVDCARRLCALQGAQGQWWWHYHARQGVVVSRYPVFAVHQDGMAPMALLKLSAVSGQDFYPPIQHGLAWLLGANELGIEIIDWDRHVVWRDIERTRPVAFMRYISMGLAGLGWTGAASLLDSGPMYKLNHEMRPYHLGWVLYAFADHQSFHQQVPRDQHHDPGTHQSG